MPIGSLWVAYHKNNDTVFAKVSAIDTSMLETGVVDTIKTIVFNYPQNNSGFSESVNGKTFVISRERGLLSFFNIVVFPGIIEYSMIPVDYYNYSNETVAAESFNPDVVDSISNADIFNLNVGDELHTKRHCWTGIMPDIYSTDSWGIKRVLHRIDSSHNITIQYRHKYKVWEADTVVNQGVDTIFETYTKNKIGVLPAYRYEGSDDFVSIGGFKVIKGRITIINSFIELIEEDGVWTYVVYKSKGLYPSHAICGLGGWYYDYIDEMFDYYNKLVYYNVSGEEWGTPLTFTVGANDIELESLKVYPNPVKDRLIINSSNLNYDADLMVFDISGKTIMNRKIQKSNSQIELNVSNLNAGVYTIQIVNGQQILTNKFIKID